MSIRRASAPPPPHAGSGRGWAWLLPLSILWAVAAPAHAQAPAFLVRDINGVPAPVGSHPGPLVQIGATTFFVAGGGLWKSDGTEAGTVLVRQGSAFGLVDVNGTLFFAASDGAGIELWKSDGTEAGTVRVRDIRPGSGGAFPCLRFDEGGP